MWLGLDYFGYAQNPGSNFVIATLNGGKRELSGTRSDLPQALQQQLAAARVLHLQLGEGEHELRLERRLPGRRALSGSARAESPTRSSRASSRTSSRRRARTSGRSASSSARRSATTPDASPARPRSPRSATCRSRLRCPTSTPASPTTGFTADAIGRCRTRAGRSSICGRGTRQRFRATRHRVLRRHLQRAGQPGLDSRSGSRRRRRATAFGEPIRFLDPRRFFLGARLTF